MSLAVRPGVLRAMDAALVTVPPLVTQRHLGHTPCHSAARIQEGKTAETPDGRHRHPIWSAAPRTAASPSMTEVAASAGQGRQARRGGGRDRSPAGRSGRARLHPTRTGPVTRCWPGQPKGVTGRLEAVRVDRGGDGRRLAPAAETMGLEVPSSRVGRQAAGLSAHPACLARRGRPVAGHVVCAPSSLVANPHRVRRTCWVPGTPQ